MKKTTEIQPQQVIVDSNIFIGLWYNHDQYHEKSKKILKNIAENEHEVIHITNYVLVETINFLMKKVDFEMVKEVLEYLTTTDRIKITIVDETMQREINTLCLQYKTLSLTDCSLLILAEKFQIKIVYSFDHGFDKIKNIERKEE